MGQREEKAFRTLKAGKVHAKLSGDPIVGRSSADRRTTGDTIWYFSRGEWRWGDFCCLYTPTALLH